jgi:hypothetical protein
MKLRMSGVMIWALALCAMCRPQTNAYAQVAPIEQHLSGGEKEKAEAEALIRQRVVVATSISSALGDGRLFILLER